MSGKKRKRQQRKDRTGPQQTPRRGIDASKAFIALIVLIAVLATAASVLSRRDKPQCPPGQVWSDAHNHCH